MSQTGSGGIVIKVVGVGGGGCNAVNRMVRDGIRGVEFIAINTDAQALALSEAPTRVQMGVVATKGLGAGGDPNVGSRAADESREEIRGTVQGADMVFVAAGMGGGTGTGAAPVVAEIAREEQCLTIAVVTKPFAFEGRRRRHVAEDGIAKLQSMVDTLLVIPNDRLLGALDHKTPLDSAFKLADDVLCHAVKAVSEVITAPGLIKLDFAGVKSVMKAGGPAWLSVGTGRGEHRAEEAARNAVSSQLLGVTLQDARGALFVVTGPSDLTLFEVNNAARIISEALTPEANVIFGVTVDPKLENEARVTLIATGGSVTHDVV